MAKFPVDAPKTRVIKALQSLGFIIVRKGEHIAMRRQNPDGSPTPLTMPKHKKIKSSTLRAICSQAGISGSEFLGAYEKS